MGEGILKKKDQMVLHRLIAPVSIIIQGMHSKKCFNKDPEASWKYKIRLTVLWGEMGKHIFQREIDFLNSLRHWRDSFGKMTNTEQ